MKRSLISHPLILMGALLVLVFLFFRLVAFHGQDDIFDPPTLMLITVAYTLSVISMVIRTDWHRWSPLGAGLLSTMAGDALFYTYVIFGWFDYTRQTVIRTEGYIDIVRSLFLIGGFFVVWGLGSEWLADRGNGVLTAKKWHRRRPDQNRQGEEGVAS